MAKRVLIALDLEGVNNVVGEPYSGLYVGCDEWERARRQAAKEVNAAAEALFMAGAERVALWDNHAGGGNVDRQTGIHDDVVKGDIFDLTSQSFGFVGEVGGVDSQTEAGLIDHQIGHGAVADDAVSDTEAHAAMTAHEYAVGDNDIFADTLRIVFEAVMTGGPDGDHIVGGTDDAVGNGDIGTAIDIDAVAIPGGMGQIGDPDAADGHVFAAVEEACPVGGIFQSDTADADICTFAEIEHLRGAPAGEFFAGAFFRIKECRTVAVDSPFAADDHVFALQSDDQMGAGSLFGNAGGVLYAEVGGVVFALVR